MRTIVYQSQAPSKMTAWMHTCTDSVRAWSSENSYAYQWLGDELFNHVPEGIRSRFSSQPIILTDLARLTLMQDAFDQGYERAVWLDADMLVFAPAFLQLPHQGHAVGREVWVQENEGKLRAYRKVHNAFLVACKGDSFLPFYRDTCVRLLERAEPPLVPQFIGPKLLTALDNISALTVCEAAGMLSALALRDVRRGRGKALELTLEGHKAPIGALNLSASYQGKAVDGIANTEAEYEQAVHQLLTTGLP